ncbi:unnamed protein product, partial [Porites lobata]
MFCRWTRWREVQSQEVHLIENSSVTSATTMETILPLHITEIVRFLNDGKKAWQLDRLQGESFFFPEHHNSSDKGNTATDVSYQLKAVIVHEGTKISSGHYICYFKRGDQWY